ncbi:MAG: hypothetical protein WCP86_06730, partial [bacterium]
YLRWLVFGSSTYYLYAFATPILSALISLLIWNWNKMIGSLWKTQENIVKSGLSEAAKAELAKASLPAVWEQVWL